MSRRRSLGESGVCAMGMIQVIGTQFPGRRAPETRSVKPEIHCEHLRGKLPGLPSCCKLCHDQNEVQLVLLDELRVAVCCTLVADIMCRWPDAFRRRDTLV